MTDAQKPTAKSPCVDPWAELPTQPDPEKLTSELPRAWMQDAAGQVIAVPLTEITMYEQRGYHRSGPRSK